MAAVSTSSVRNDASREARRARSRDFAIAAARACADARCRDVIVLDVKGISPICDFIVLATGQSERQMQTVAYEVEDVGREFDLKPLLSQKRAEAATSWVAIDLVDVMVHVLTEEARAYYDLDNLWGDAPKVPWLGEDEGTQAQA